MYNSICIYIIIYTLIYLHTYIQTDRQTDRQTYRHTYIHLFKYVLCMFMYVHICSYMFIYVHCLYMFIYVHIHGSEAMAKFQPSQRVAIKQSWGLQLLMFPTTGSNRSKFWWLEWHQPFIFLHMSNMCRVAVWWSMPPTMRGKPSWW